MIGEMDHRRSNMRLDPRHQRSKMTVEAVHAGNYYYNVNIGLLKLGVNGRMCWRFDGYHGQGMDNLQFHIGGRQSPGEELDQDHGVVS